MTGEIDQSREKPLSLKTAKGYKFPSDIGIDPSTASLPCPFLTMRSTDLKKKATLGYNRSSDCNFRAFHKVAKLPSAQMELAWYCCPFLS